MQNATTNIEDIEDIDHKIDKLTKQKLKIIINKSVKLIDDLNELKSINDLLNKYSQPNKIKELNIADQSIIDEQTHDDNNKTLVKRQHDNTDNILTEKRLRVKHVDQDYVQTTKQPRVKRTNKEYVCIAKRSIPGRKPGGIYVPLHKKYYDPLYLKNLSKPMAENLRNTIKNIPNISKRTLNHPFMINDNYTLDEPDKDDFITVKYELSDSDDLYDE